MNTLINHSTRGRALFPATTSRQLARRRRPVAQPVRVLSSSKDSSPSSTNNSPAESMAHGAASTVVVEAPTSRQLRIVALRSAIPMVGFGFMDNLVMIQAGEAIDMSIGVSFGLSTMTAAGFGQCVSDVAGFTCGGMVDAAVTKMRLPHHNLTLEQLDLKSSRAWHTFGGCVGVVTGCLMGMSCLLFMDTDKADRAKKAKELQSIFESVLVEGHTLIDAGTTPELLSVYACIVCISVCPTIRTDVCVYLLTHNPCTPFCRTSYTLDVGRR